MKPTQYNYKEIIESNWRGYTAQEICERIGKKLNANAYKRLTELSEKEDYEVYEAKHKSRYTRKAYRKKLPKYEFGILGILLLIILWERQDWISVEELKEIVDKKLSYDIISVIVKLEDLKECGFVIEDQNEMFFRIKVLDNE